MRGVHSSVPADRVPEVIHVGEQWAPTGMFRGESYHTGWEFFLQISGKTTWRATSSDTSPNEPFQPHNGAQEQIIKLESGMLLGLAPGVPHEHITNTRTPYNYCYVSFFLEPVLRRHPELIDHWPRESIIVQRDVSFLAEPFRSLKREASLAEPIRETGLRLTLDQLALEICRVCTHRRHTPEKVVTHPAVAQARAILDNEFQEKWTIDELAKVVGVSGGHLSECFSRELGMSIHRYQTEVRIEHACQILSQTDTPVTDLGGKLGFSSSQHFATAFKKTTGMSPSEYRQAKLPSLGLLQHRARKRAAERKATKRKAVKNITKKTPKKKAPQKAVKKPTREAAQKTAKKALKKTFNKGLTKLVKKAPQKEVKKTARKTFKKLSKNLVKKRSSRSR